MLFLLNCSPVRAEAPGVAARTADRVHFDQVWNREYDMFALERFCRGAEPRPDIGKIVPEIMTALEQKGYHFMPAAGKKSYRVRTDIAVGDCTEEYHYASADGTLTLDFVVYRDDQVAQDNYTRQAVGGPANGSNDRFCLAQLLLPKGADAKPALAVKWVSNGTVINLNWILPFNVGWDVMNFDKYPDGRGAPQSLLDLLPDKKWHATASDYRNTLSELMPRLDSLYAMTHLIVEHLIVADDLALMPKPGKPQVTTAERIAAFARLWTEVKYNFANFDLVPNLDWDRTRERFLPLVENAQSDDEFHRLLQRLLAKLQDGHTSLMWAAGSWPSMVIRSIEGKAVITDLSEEDEAAKNGLKRGTEITHVDGRPVSEIISEKYPYVSASTPQSRDCIAYARLLEGPTSSKVTFTVKDISGRAREVTLTRPGNNQGSFLDRPPFEYRSLPGDVAYVALNSFGNSAAADEFDKIFDEKIRPAKGLIIDVRENGGGSSSVGYAVISRLIDKPLPASKSKTRQYLPAMAAWGKEPTWHDLGQDVVTPRGDNPYLGPVAVLTSPATFSAGEDFLIPLKWGKRATLVGERTGGSTGQPMIVDLGSGVKARICAKRDTYPDGSEFVGVGVIPDIEVHPTQKGIAEGKDTVLDAALAAIKKMRALTPPIPPGAISQARSSSGRAPDPPFRVP